MRLLCSGEVTLERCEHYQKRSFRNKCVIATAHGPLILTVPLAKGKHQQQLISKTQISYDEDWQHQHLHAIKSAYGRAPYFEHYIGEITDFFHEKEAFLFDLNWKIMQKVGALLQTSFRLSESVHYQPLRSHSSDYRNAFTPRTYWKWLQDLTYPQVFSDRQPFLANLSILDLIFNAGPAALPLLTQHQLDHAS